MLGSSQRRAGGRLSPNGKTLIQADGQSVPLQLVQNSPYNKSWFNEASRHKRPGGSYPTLMSTIVENNTPNDIAP